MPVTSPVLIEYMIMMSIIESVLYMQPKRSA